MEEMNQTPQAPQSAPGFLKVLVVLTYIFSSLGILGCLIGIFASGWFMSMIPVSLPIEGGALVGIVIAVCLIMIGLEVITMIGASKMAKLKKSGFWMWIIPNGLYLIFLLLLLGSAAGGGSIFGLLVTIFMFVGYIANFKHLK